MMSIIAATQAALAGEMRRDPRIWLLGEDLRRGGVFGQYAGFVEEFGPERVVSTPISEAMIASVGLGAALAGTRPVVEMRIADFALCAMDEIVNQIAKVRYMFGGQARAPLVIRMPHGISRFSAAQHSQCLEAWMAHIPGLTVVAPARADDAAGLMLSALRADDPVIFFEPRNIWTEEADVPNIIEATPIGVARSTARGTDVTVISWSTTSSVAMKAAKIAGEQGISAEVIDLRSLWPWDADAVVASAERTGRVVIAQEAVRDFGFGAEVAATVMERAWRTLKRPVVRIGAPRTPVPYSPPLEELYRVTPEKIVEAMRMALAN